MDIHSQPLIMLFGLQQQRLGANSLLRPSCTAEHHTPHWIGSTKHFLFLLQILLGKMVPSGSTEPIRGHTDDHLVCHESAAPRSE